jgi:hypothetical protein
MVDAKRKRREWNGDKVTIHKLDKQSIRSTFQ